MLNFFPNGGDYGADGDGTREPALRHPGVAFAVPLEPLLRAVAGTPRLNGGRGDRAPSSTTDLPTRGGPFSLFSELPK